MSRTELEGVLILEPDVFQDVRVFFMESYNKERYAQLGIDCDFVQDNLSFSSKGVLRGLHYQYPHAQGKLVQVLQGEVWDVAVDIRRGSPQFGRWTAVSLSALNRKQLYVPPGFAHGFCVVSDTALFSYKCTESYYPEHEAGIRWDDADIGIQWPIAEPVLSGKDRTLPCLADIPERRLPER